MKVWRSVREALALLSRRDRRLLLLVIVLQASLSLLDLIAIALIGIVAALAAGAATGQTPAAVDQLLSRVGLTADEPYSLAIGLAAVAGVLMITKSVLSFLSTRRIFRFLASRQAMVSSRLSSKLLQRPLLEVQRRPSQEVAYALTIGVNALTLGVIGLSTVIVSEISLLLALAIGLMFIDPLVTVFTILFFVGVALALHRIIAGWAARLGRQAAATQVASSESLQDILRAYREVSVAGTKSVYVEKISDLRWSAARVQSDLQIVSQIAKYVFEVALIIGGAILAASQLLTRDVTAAVAVIAVFLAAASRVMPSLLRLQSAILNVRSNAGIAAPTFELAKELDAGDATGATSESAVEVCERLVAGMEAGYPGFRPAVEVRDVTMRFPGASEWSIRDITLDVPAGTSLALVGSTGAGKSTLADLILGVMSPDSGDVLISGKAPADAIREWPGAVAYVPQAIAVVNADVRSNVALGLPSALVDDDRVWSALEQAQLSALLRHDREGLSTEVGEHGLSLSGGQLQRLGLARALYTQPRLLILDEATSALDANTEQMITQTILGLAGDMTRIIIAHRLATVRDCDQVAYLDQGRLRAVGTFDQVRAAVPEFARAVELGSIDGERA